MSKIRVGEIGAGAGGEVVRRKVVIDTLNGLQTIEGLTVSAVRGLLAKCPDGAVVIFMFEPTPTIREQINKTNLMVMPAHAVYGGSPDVACIVGPEIENAKYEKPR